MSTLEANLRALEVQHPDLGRALRSLPARADRGQWTTARSGLPTVRRGTALASAFDPVAEAERAVPLDTDSDFFLLAGLGAGYHAEAVARRYPEVPLVIAEADPAWFREVLAHRDLSALWSSAFVVPLVGPGPDAVGAFLEAQACRRVRTVAWRPVAEQEPGWVDALAAQVTGAQARARVNLATYQRFGALWQRNWNRNQARAHDVRPLAALEGLWRGVPAVVAAAGPSLGDALRWVASHRDRVVLIAVDTAWPALAAQGLAPDVLVVLDGQYANARHVDRAPPETTLVVTEWTGPARAFQLAPGRTYVAETSLPFLRRREKARWGELGRLASGGSVATAAYSLALHLGCSEVAFAGLDLGYPRGLTHAAGSQFEEALHRASNRLRPAETTGLGLRSLEGASWVPALDGGVVLSDARMDLFRSWLSRAVAARPEVRAYNLGRHGSVVPHLVSAPETYGDGFPPRPPFTRRPVAPLVPQGESDDEPPFATLQATLTADDFPTAAGQAWEAARAYWGAAVWDAWAGRAWTTWQRFPSLRSRRAVEEVVETALDWRRFWDSPRKNSKWDSRSDDARRE